MMIGSVVKLLTVAYASVALVPRNVLPDGQAMCFRSSMSGLSMDASGDVTTR
jgi:hypothetical protein